MTAHGINTIFDVTSQAKGKIIPIITIAYRINNHGTETIYKKKNIG